MDIAGRRLSLAGVLIFLAGLTSTFSVRVIGLLFYGEILLLFVAFWAVCTTAGERKFWSRSFVLTLCCLAISLTGYIISDLVWNSDLNEFLKGWSRFLCLGSNLIAIKYLVRGRKQRVAYFFLGYVIGALMPDPGDPSWLDHWRSGAVMPLASRVNAAMGWSSGDNWKFGAAMPLTVAIFLSAPLLRRPLLISVVSGALGILHILLDYRSLGGICMLMAIILFPRGARVRSRRSFVALQLAAAGVGAVLFAYFYSMSDANYRARRLGSNGWRMSAFHTALQGISNSPWIGYGSWIGYGTKESSSAFQSIFDQEYAGHAAADSVKVIRDYSVFAPHSQLVQAWFEGGVMALTLFVYLAWKVSRALFLCIFDRRLDYYTPLFLLRLLLAAWDVLFSPFNGPQRINIAVVLVITYLLDAERRALAFPRREASVVNPELRMAVPAY